MTTMGYEGEWIDTIIERRFMQRREAYDYRGGGIPAQYTPGTPSLFQCELINLAFRSRGMTSE